MPKTTTLILLTAFFLAVGLGGFWAGSNFTGKKQIPTSQTDADDVYEETTEVITSLDSVPVISPSIGPLTYYKTLGRVDFHTSDTVSLTVPKESAAKLSKNTPVYLFAKESDISPLQVSITGIDHTEENSRLILKLTDENPDEALLRYKYEARIAEYDEPAVRRIPKSALRQDKNGNPVIWSIWQDEKNDLIAIQKPARILFESETLAAITQETARADQILVLAPPEGLTQNQKIQNIELQPFPAPTGTAAQELADAQARHAFAKTQERVLAEKKRLGTDKCHLQVDRYGVPYAKKPGGGVLDDKKDQDGQRDGTQTATGSCPGTGSAGGCAGGGCAARQ